MCIIYVHFEREREREKRDVTSEIPEETTKEMLSSFIFVLALSTHLPCLTYSSQQTEVATENKANWTVSEGAGLHAQGHMGRSPYLADHQDIYYLCIPRVLQFH